jgi:hypothetical protein
MARLTDFCAMVNGFHESRSAGSLVIFEGWEFVQIDPGEFGRHDLRPGVTSK